MLDYTEKEIYYFDRNGIIRKFITTADSSACQYEADNLDPSFFMSSPHFPSGTCDNVALFDKNGHMIRRIQRSSEDRPVYYFYDCFYYHLDGNIKCPYYFKYDMEKINRIPTAEEFLNQFFVSCTLPRIDEPPNFPDENKIAEDRALLEALLEAAHGDISKLDQLAYRGICFVGTIGVEIISGPDTKEEDTMLTKMNFEFADREGSGLQVVNDMLMGVKFADLEIVDFDGYLAKCRQFDANGKEMDVTYRYDFDSLTLGCTMDPDSDGARYQLAAEVIPDHEDSQDVHKRWVEAYPDRRMRSQTMMNFANEGKNVSVILYYCVE